MASISLCMIVRDEEAVLGRCLESVAPAVDEIIVVDTGSMDGTKAVAAAYTDRISDFAWVDDFAAARNASFAKATGDYILWLDADDVLLPEDLDALLCLKNRLDQVPADVVMMRYNTGFDSRGNPCYTFPSVCPSCGGTGLARSGTRIYSVPGHQNYSEYCRDASINQDSVHHPKPTDL